MRNFRYDSLPDVHLKLNDGKNGYITGLFQYKKPMRWKSAIQPGSSR